MSLGVILPCYRNTPQLGLAKPITKGAEYIRKHQAWYPPHRMPPSWRQSKMVTRRILSLPPADIPNLQLHMEQSLRKTPENLLNISFSVASEKRGGEAGTQSCHKPQPQHSNPQSEENLQIQSFFLRQGKVGISHQDLNFHNLHLRDKTPKYLTLKTNRAFVYKTQRAIANWETALKGIMCWPTHPRTPRESLQDTQPICEGDPFANLRVSTKWTVVC